MDSIGHNQMTVEDFHAERERIREALGDTSKEATAKRDMALADLFYRSGWTQERLAEVEGKSQSWVKERLRFGRFLNFSAMALKSESLPKDLTERLFRKYWEATDKSLKKDELRFREVIRMIEDGIELKTRARVFKDIVDQFCDGKLYSPEEIAKAIDAPHEDVNRVLDAACKPKSQYRHTARVEAKKSGKDMSPNYFVRYRLFKADKNVPLSEVRQKLSPLIKDLAQQSENDIARFSRADCKRIASELRNLIKEWGE